MRYKRKQLFAIFLFTIVLSTVSYASDTTSDLLAIYDNSVYTPSQKDLRQFNSEMSEYNKLLKKEQSIQSFNDSVLTAQQQMEEMINNAQNQVQELLSQSVECSSYIEENIYGDFNSLVKKDAEYKQCYRAADSLLNKVNKMQIPPLLVSVSLDIEEKEESIAEKKELLELQVVDKVEGEFELGDVYKINNLTGNPYLLLSDYGSRINPATSSTIEYHNGIDLQAPAGTDVYAMFNGKVLEAGDNWAMGNYVRIQHGSGVISLYGHLSTISVKTGQTVDQYDIIGKSGKTGANVVDDYLYLSLFINGRSVNPKILLERGNAVER